MNPIRTLIVDDEEMIRKGVARLVASCGEEWEVAGTAGDGQEALALLEQCGGNVDLLITDVKMPVMDGLTLIEEARKRYRIYPLVISGYDDFEYVKTALREGALDYVLKPIDREQFRKRLSEIRDVIVNERMKQLRLRDIERRSQQLERTRQIQLLSYVTSAGLDISRLGYWVEEFPRGTFVLMLLGLDTPPVKARSFTDKDWGAFEYALENIIAETAESVVSGDRGQVWCWRGYKSGYWVLLQIPATEAEEEANQLALMLAERIRTSVKTYTPFTMSAAFGRPIADLYMLPEAMREAYSHMNYRLLYGGNRTYSPGMAELAADGQEEEGVSPADYREWVQLLKQAVNQGREDEVIRCLNELFQQLGRLGSPSRITYAVQTIYLALYAVGLEHGLEQDDHEVEQVLAAVKHAVALNELKIMLERIAIAMLQQIRASRSNYKAAPVEQAKAWIADHLHEEISIKQIADHVYMNPSYLSRLFKLQTGETILDYVTSQRMEQARMLLRNPDLKLQEICERVGYKDVKYFSRLFKEYEGVAPSQYRKQHLRSQAL